MTMTRYANDVSAGITTVEVLDCATCGVIFGADVRFIKNRRADGRGFYCPNGHCLTFGKTELDRAREELDWAKKRLGWAEARETHEHDQRQAAERSARAYKGQVTKIKRRVGNGVCPCCNRTFADLARHMNGQHPGYGDGGTA